MANEKDLNIEEFIEEIRSNISSGNKVYMELYTTTLRNWLDDKDYIRDPNGTFLRQLISSYASLVLNS